MSCSSTASHSDSGRAARPRLLYRSPAEGSRYPVHALSEDVESLSLATPEGGLVRYRGSRPLGCMFCHMIRLPGRIPPLGTGSCRSFCFHQWGALVGILPAVQCSSWLSTMLLGDGQTCNSSGGTTALSVPFSLKQRVQGHAIVCALETNRVDIMVFFRPRRWSLMEHQRRPDGCIEGVVGSVVPASLI